MYHYFYCLVEDVGCCFGSQPQVAWHLSHSPSSNYLAKLRLWPFCSCICHSISKWHYGGTVPWFLRLTNLEIHAERLFTFLCTYQWYARLPPSRAIVGNEGEIFFVLLQNRALVVGHLPTPVFYKQSTCIWDIYLMMFSFSAKSSSVCTVCVNNGYVHFTCR